MCLWHYLALHHHSGQDHNIDSVLTHQRPGSLVVRCPTCPEAGFNVEEWVMELAPDEKTWVNSDFMGNCTEANGSLATYTRSLSWLMEISSFNGKRRMMTHLTNLSMLAMHISLMMTGTKSISSPYLTKQMSVFFLMAFVIITYGPAHYSILSARN